MCRKHGGRNTSEDRWWDLDSFVISPGPRLDLARISPKYGYQPALHQPGSVNIPPRPGPPHCSQPFSLPGSKRDWSHKWLIFRVASDSRACQYKVGPWCRCHPFLIGSCGKTRQRHAFRLLLRNIWETSVDKRPHGVLANVDIIFYLFPTTVHTRPDGDSENLALEKGTFIDLKMALLHSASHWVVDMDALTCLTSWMHSVPCSFHLDSTYALTFTSGCSHHPFSIGICLI